MLGGGVGRQELSKARNHVIGLRLFQPSIVDDTAIIIKDGERAAPRSLNIKPDEVVHPLFFTLGRMQR
jgi:hypothetical protein